MTLGIKPLIAITLTLCLASIAIPNFIRAQQTKVQTATDDSAKLYILAENLRALELAKEQWALVNKKALSDNVWLGDLTGYLPFNIAPAPIAGETYDVNSIGAFAEAFLPAGNTLGGMAGPFTVTSF